MFFLTSMTLPASPPFHTIYPSGILESCAAWEQNCHWIPSQKLPRRVVNAIHTTSNPILNSNFGWNGFFKAITSHAGSYIYVCWCYTCTDKARKLLWKVLLAPKQCGKQYACIGEGAGSLVHFFYIAATK